MKSIELLLAELDENLKSEHVRIGALALSLIAIDICSKVEYKDETKQSVRYPKWCDNYLLKYFPVPLEIEQNDILRFNGEICYQIRCAFLHSGDKNLNTKNLNCKINFEFALPSNLELSIIKQENMNTYNFKLSINKFVKYAFQAVLDYYQSFKYKFTDISEFKFCEVEVNFI